MPVSEVDDSNWFKAHPHRNFFVRDAIPHEREGLDLPRQCRAFSIVRRGDLPIAFAASASFDPAALGDVSAKSLAAELSGERGRVGRTGKRWANDP
jgi:hypothetical protein